MNKGNFTGFLFLNFIGYLVNLNQRAKKMGLLRNYKLILVLFYLISIKAIAQVIPGAYQTQKYLPALKGKQVALVVNHTSVINKTHLADSC